MTRMDESTRIGKKSITAHHCELEFVLFVYLWNSCPRLIYISGVRVKVEVYYTAQKINK